MESRATTPHSPGVMLSALAGLATGAIVLASWWVLYSVNLLTFPPFDLGDWFIRQSPGAFATWAIETLGDAAQSAALAGGVGIMLLAWALLGVGSGRLGDGWPARLLPLALLPLALALAWWTDDAGVGTAIWYTLVFGGTLLAGGAGLSHWLDRMWLATQSAAPSSDYWLDRPGDYERRALMRQLAIATVALAGGGTILGRLLKGSSVGDVVTAQAMPLADARVALATPAALPTPQPAPPLPDGFSAPAGVRQRQTDNDEFYVVDISTRDPNLPEDGWALRIHGLVERGLLISWPELLEMPPVELDGTLMCISYEHDNGLISTTRWTGVPLRDVLQQAGVRDGAVELICRGANGYSDSIPLQKALEQTTLLAYGMNGTTLPRSHGFPCRLYVPGLYGEKNVKWLEEIELVEYDYLGYWQERGWSDTATVNTVSIIDTPRGTVQRDNSGSVPIGGIAFAGQRGISAVQVRVDDGQWQDAQLEANEPPLIWQRWRFDWQPDLGSYRLTVRAVDGDGNPQDEQERPPHPDGMTGLHTVEVDVV
ncbi:MAG TPA: molybdopterin-dependent oxidoreductase [Thermomicrobiales bacterium]|nr:molybdopterin-dependent oxidoreductase [Thermomicrobiales bacterium]